MKEKNALLQITFYTIIFFSIFSACNMNRNEFLGSCIYEINENQCVEFYYNKNKAQEAVETYNSITGKEYSSDNLDEVKEVYEMFCAVNGEFLPDKCGEYVQEYVAKCDCRFRDDTNEWTITYSDAVAVESAPDEVETTCKEDGCIWTDNI